MHHLEHLSSTTRPRRSRLVQCSRLLTALTLFPSGESLSSGGKDSPPRGIVIGSSGRFDLFNRSLYLTLPLSRYLFLPALSLSLSLYDEASLARKMTRYFPSHWREEIEPATIHRVGLSLSRFEIHFVASTCDIDVFDKIRRRSLFN